MSVDKLVDSTQLDSDLTSVADAIRAKSGGSGQLAFPSGFVSEIGNIPSGGSTKIFNPYAYQRDSEWPAIEDVIEETDHAIYFSCYVDPDILSQTGLVFKFSRNSDVYCYTKSGDTYVKTKVYDENSHSYFAQNEWYYPRGTEVEVTGWQILKIVPKESANLYNSAPYNTSLITCFEYFMFGGIDIDERLMDFSHVRLDRVVSNKVVRAVGSNDGIYSILELYDCDFSAVTDFNYFGLRNVGVMLMFMHKLKISQSATVLSYAFADYGKFNHALDLSQADLSGATNTSYMFRNGDVLEHLTMGIAPAISFSISALTRLTHDSVMNVVNALPTVQTTQTLTMGSTLMNKLSADEIAVATAKGWTVA